MGTARHTLITLAGALAVAVGLLAPLPARAEPAHDRPQGPAKVRFGPGFPKVMDAEWGFQVGGFGGIRPNAPRRHAPVIFVHGNNVDHADWYPVRDAFKAAGWTDQELFALSYNGLGGANGTALLTQNPERDAEHTEMGWDGMTRITNNDINVRDFYDFVLAVRRYTRSAKFHVVAHSLGVTLARRVLQMHPELRPDLVSFVSIAGANHGTSFCPPQSEHKLVSCHEIAAGTRWLAQLNGINNTDETYKPARWLSIYDGTGLGDPAFAATYAQSPMLIGADNRQYPLMYHNDLRMDPAVVKDYRTFIEDAERRCGARCGARA